MYEMIYGNTGKRDEGINISMDQSLYQKLSGRTIVPKLKSMLSDAHQQGDKSFVYIGEVADKAGSFTVYGYNAKLEGDSRGGDYGHYVAVPLDEKAATINIDKVNYLTEEGFIEYVNQQTLNDSKRFNISPLACDVDINAKKRIVNNLMETFMKVRKRKNVTFCFEETTVEEFSAKSVAILLDLVKYLPYRMRKNVAFVSHVCTSAKADSINLIAYPSSCDAKPHDCINTEEANAPLTDGLFTAYVEKVFAMNDSEREAYFEKLYTEIEMPAINAGVDVRSDLYLLDVATKELWKGGDIAEAVRNMFASVTDILKVYPEYLEIAKNRLSANTDAVIAYIQGEVSSTGSVQELKPLYLNMKDLSDVCGLGLDGHIVSIMKNHASIFVDGAMEDESLISIADCIVDINPDILDADVVKAAINRIMAKKTDINGIYCLYMAVADKNYINQEELEICLTENTDNFIVNATIMYSESKDKLSRLKQLYTDFQIYCPATEYPLVEQVYRRYLDIFSGDASSEAVKKGSEIIYDVERILSDSCNLWEIKDCVISLSGIEAERDAGLKARTADMYRRVTDKLYDILDSNYFEYGEFSKFVTDITPAVNHLDDMGVYDRATRSTMEGESVPFDGMHRFVSLFGTLMSALDGCEAMTGSVVAYENAAKTLSSEEFRLEKVFGKYGPLVLHRWCVKHPKVSNDGQLKKAKKTLEKKQSIKVSEYTSAVFNKVLLRVKESKKGKGKSPLIIIIVAAVLAVALLACGGFAVYKIFFSDAEVTEVTPNTVAQYIEQDAVDAVEEYLAGFAVDGVEDAKVVVGALSSGEDGVYNIHIADKPASTDTEQDITGAFSTANPNSKNYYTIDDVDSQEKKVKKYAMVIQEAAEDEGFDFYIHDIFMVPDDLKDYDYSKEYTDDIVKDAEDVKFCTQFIQYVAYSNNVLTLKSAEDTDNKESGNGETKPGQEEQVNNPPTPSKKL